MYFLINCVNGTLAFFRNSLLLSRESNEAPQKSILVSYEEVSLSLQYLSQKKGVKREG